MIRVLLLLTLLLAACGAPAQPAAENGAGAPSAANGPATPKHVTVTIKGDPPTLSAAVDQAGSGGTDGLSELEQFVHVGLLAVSGDGTLVPRLAREAPTVDNGLWVVFPDGRMQTTWHLAPNTRWQDGEPLTADDFVFTAMVAKDRTVPLFREGAYDIIDQIEAPDPQTLVVTWSQPYISADRLFTSSNQSRILPMPKHILERAYEDERLTFTQLPYWSAEFVGAGPFKLKEWTLGSSMVLTANDLYVMGRPKIDEVEALFILDPSTIVANVLAGSVDVTMGRGVSLEQAIQARDQLGGHGRIEAALLTWTALFPQFLNPSPALVGDVTFRRALLYAIDRQELSDSLQAGYSPVADTIISPNDPDYAGIAGSVVKYEYDPSRATALLDSLGLKRGPDGAYRDAAGQHISLEVRTTKDDLRERLIHPIGDYWQKVGIGMEPVIIATQAASDRSYRATFPAFELTRQPNELNRYRSTNIPTSDNGFRGNNRVRYANPDFDALLDRYFSTIPPRERSEELGEIVHVMGDQLLTLGIFYTVEPALISGRVQNVTPRKVEDGRISWNANEWDVTS